MNDPMPVRPCKGRRRDSRGPYSIHVLVPVAEDLESACLQLPRAPVGTFTREQPTEGHPICHVCSRVSDGGLEQTLPPKTPVRPRMAPPAAAPVAPATRPLELSHRIIWASHAFASASRLAIVDELARRGRMKTEALREACGQWEGMFDLSMDALIRGRIVDASGKYATLTDFGRRLFEAVETICAAGDGEPSPAAPTQLY